MFQKNRQLYKEKEEWNVEKEQLMAKNKGPLTSSSSMVSYQVYNVQNSLLSVTCSMALFRLSQNLRNFPVIVAAYTNVHYTNYWGRY